MTAPTAASRPEFVVCIDNADYPASLELHKIYRALRDDQAADAGDLRVIDEYVEDVDAVYRRALDAGAEPITAPEDKPYGERGCGFRAFDNIWWVATYLG